jgi:hypothetical protein
MLLFPLLRITFYYLNYPFPRSVASEYFLDESCCIDSLVNLVNHFLCLQVDRLSKDIELDCLPLKCLVHAADWTFRLIKSLSLPH